MLIDTDSLEEDYNWLVLDIEKFAIQDKGMGTKVLQMMRKLFWY